VDEDLIQSGIGNHTFGPTNVREHFLEEELTRQSASMLPLKSHCPHVGRIPHAGNYWTVKLGGKRAVEYVASQRRKLIF